MRILVVGGGIFLGPAVIAAARAAGHEVAVFNRGRSAVDAEVERLVGERNTDLSALRGRSWDIVVDTCAYAPDQVSVLLDALEQATGRYVFVSSGSVYADFSHAAVAETDATKAATADDLERARAVSIEDRGRASSYGEAYGKLKRACETVAQDRLGERALIVRAGLLVGPGDYTDRLTAWVRRIARGGPTLAPGRPDRPMQIVDVRDAAAWMIRAASQGLGGVFNVTGPARPLTMGGLFEACRRVAGSDAHFVWVPDDSLLAAGLVPWDEVPLWIPEHVTHMRHFLDVSIAKALAHGLTFRPLDDTLADILRWDRARGPVPLKTGIPTNKERDLLQTPGIAAALDVS